jgi:uncharacterized coiled-coil protein SlyX
MSTPFLASSAPVQSKTFLPTNEPKVSSRYSLNKNQMVTILAVISAVAGLAYLIFKEPTIVAIAFALCGIVTLVYQSTQNSSEIEKTAELAKKSAASVITRNLGPLQGTGSKSQQCEEIKIVDLNNQIVRLTERVNFFQSNNDLDSNTVIRSEFKIAAFKEYNVKKIFHNLTKKLGNLETIENLNTAINTLSNYEDVYTKQLAALQKQIKDLNLKSSSSQIQVTNLVPPQHCKEVNAADLNSQIASLTARLSTLESKSSQLIESIKKSDAEIIKYQQRESEGLKALLKKFTEKQSKNPNHQDKKTIKSLKSLNETVEIKIDLILNLGRKIYVETQTIEKKQLEL